MRGQKQEIEWEPEDVRVMLDFIDGRENKNSRADYLALIQYMRKIDQNYVVSVPDISKKLSKIFRAARKERYNNVTHLWKFGSASLQLRHKALEGVYTEEEIAAREHSQGDTIRRDNADTSVVEQSTVRAPSTTSNENVEDDSGEDTDTFNTRTAKSHKQTSVRKRREDDPDADFDPEEPEHKKHRTSRKQQRQEGPALETQLITIKVPTRTAQQSRRLTNETRSTHTATSTIPDATQQIQPSGEIPELDELNTKPQTAAMTAEIGTIYKLIRMSVVNHYMTLGLDPNEPLAVNSRILAGSGAELVDNIFGKGHSDLAFNLSKMLEKKPMSVSVIVRALIGTATYLWVFKPSLLGSDIDRPTLNAEGQLLSSLTLVLENNFTEGLVNQLKHQATRLTIEHSEQEIRARAQGLARRMFVALSSFFRSNQLEYTSNIKDGSELRPLAEDEAPYGVFPVDRPPLPEPNRNWIFGEDKFYSGTGTFESRLVEIFEKALDLRKSWEVRWDAQLIFDFPIAGTDFDERVHFNEEAVKAGKKRKVKPGIVDSDASMASKVFMCMFPGVSAQIRPAYDQDYGDRVLISRAPVIMLE